MSHSNKDRSHSSLSWIRYDQFIAFSDGVGGVGPVTTPLSSHKVYLGPDRYDVGFRISRYHNISSPLDSLLSKYYLVVYYGGYPFGIAAGHGKGSVNPRTAHFSSQKVVCCFDGGDFLSSQSRYYPSMSHFKKYVLTHPSYHRIYVRFSASSDGEGDVSPRNTHFSSQKIYFGEYRHAISVS